MHDAPSRSLTEAICSMNTMIDFLQRQKNQHPFDQVCSHIRVGEGDSDWLDSIQFPLDVSLLHISIVIEDERESEET